MIFPPKIVPMALVSEGKTSSVITTADSLGCFAGRGALGFMAGRIIDLRSEIKAD
jgi:hypothetical protein